MPELNNIQPRRLVVPRRETSKTSGPVVDSKTDESHDVSVKQGAATLTTVNYDSASITQPSVLDTPTDKGKFMSIDIQQGQGQPGFRCDCRTNNMVDSPCLKCRHNVLLDAPKKVQFALGNDARPHGKNLLVSV